MSAITVLFMITGVTHFGVRYTDGTVVWVVGSVAVAFSSVDGAVFPARRYEPRATAACASR